MRDVHGWKHQCNVKNKHMAEHLASILRGVTIYNISPFTSLDYLESNASLCGGLHGSAPLLQGYLIYYCCISPRYEKTCAASALL